MKSMVKRRIEVSLTAHVEMIQQLVLSYDPPDWTYGCSEETAF